MAHCDGTSSVYAPSGITAPDNSEDVDSGIQPSFEIDTELQETSSGSEPKSAGDRESSCGEPEPETSQNQSGKFWKPSRSESSSSDSPDRRSSLTGNETSGGSEPKRTGDGREPPFGEPPSEPSQGGEQDSAPNIYTDNEDAKKLERLQIKLGHCIRDAIKSITVFDEEVEDLGARRDTTTTTQQQIQPAVASKKGSNMRLKHIYSQLFFSILLVLETMKKREMKQTGTWEKMYKLSDGGLHVYAEAILSYMKTMHVHTLPFQDYPNAKELVGLRNAAGHANISYQIWFDDETTTVDVRFVRMYAKPSEPANNLKDEILERVYRCTYEHLCIICKDIRTAFLQLVRDHDDRL